MGPHSLGRRAKSPGRGQAIFGAAGHHLADTAGGRCWRATRSRLSFSTSRWHFLCVPLRAPTRAAQSSRSDGRPGVSRMTGHDGELAGPPRFEPPLVDQCRGDLFIVGK